MSQILREADQIAGTDRSRDYGHPRKNFQRIAGLWAAYMAGRKPGPIVPEDVAAMMILMKIAREQHTPKRDNRLDIAGYVKCWDMLGDECVERDSGEALGPIEALSMQEFIPHDDGQATPPPPEQPKGFWYLATPYRAHPSGFDVAFVEACRQAALLTDAGICVFSPIAHSHPLARHTGTLDHFSPEWIRLGLPMLRASVGVIVCELPGWEASKGIAIEIEEAVARQMPVIHMTPDVVPERVRRLSR